MNMLDAKPLTSAEARKLNQFLQLPHLPEDTLNLAGLKGYLFAVCTTPAPLQPGDWLPSIFGGEMPELQSDSEADNIGLIIKLYNHINDDVLQGRSKLPPGCKLAAKPEDNFKPGHALHDWADGFSRGMSMFEYVWQELVEPGTESFDMLIEYWGLFSFFALNDLTPLHDEMPDAPPLDELVKAARENIPAMLKEYAVLSRHTYELLIGEMDDEPINFQPALFDDDDGPASPVEQLLMEAFEAGTRDEAADCARQALALEPLSVEAHLVLAQTAQSLPERTKWLQQAVEAGEKFFGDAFFKDSQGHFWGLRETRPFMTALADLAMSYKLEGKLDKAISHYERCLALNPGDNQGVRYSLVSCYIQKNQLEKADQLMREYDEASTFVDYARTLICFIREGDSPAARLLKKHAIANNKHVPKLLAGRSKMPRHMPEYYSPGDKNEAVMYVTEQQTAWRNVIGAVGWLLK